MCYSIFILMVLQISYNFMIVHQRPLNWNHYKLYENLMVFDGTSNNNEIA
jgi:hypothetical protein